jgi:iron complex outermembrane receptor protein
MGVLAVAASGYERPAQAQDTSDVLMEEITVTARKREESAQETPIAITAFSAEALEARGVRQTAQLAAFTPNLTLQRSPGYGGSTNTAAIYIRGIGQFDFLGSIEPGVGMYVDGVYIARSIGGIMDLVDVERIEVLRGPQGTLFGRNTIGGAIHIITRKPGDEPEARLEATYGDDDHVIVKGTVGGPLAGGLSGKLTLRYTERDGYVDQISTGNDLGDKDTTSALAQLRWEVNDKLTISTAFDYTRDRSDGAPWVLRGANLSSRIFNPNNVPYVPPRGASPFSVDGSVRPFVDVSTLPHPEALLLGVSGAEGALATGAFALPPGVDPAGPFYELNVQPLAGEIPGVPPFLVGVLAFPYDAPADNFAVLNNYLATFLGGQPCISGPFGPYDPAASDAPPCFSERFYEQNLGEFKQAGTFPTFAASDIYGISGTIEWQLGPIQIVSLTAYRDLNANFDADADYTPLTLAHLQDWFDQWQVSQEIQFKGLAFNDRLNWIVGGYYFEEDIDNQNDVFFPPVSVRSGGIINNKSYAGFGQGTFAVTDDLSLTFGIRYTKDEKTFDSDPYQYLFESRTPVFLACSNVTVAGCTSFVTTGGVTLGQLGSLTVFGEREATQEASEWTPYVNLAYHWTPDLMTYFSYSEGFKSGGFTQRILPLENAPSIAPEFATVYEGGFKSQWLDNRLRFNGAVFYTDYTDLQVQGFTPETGIAPIYRNAAAASLLGFELELQAAPAEGWFVEGAVGYLDDEYDEIAEGVIGLDITDRFERVSKWTASGAVQKEFALTDGWGSVVPRIDVAYRSKFYNDASNVEQISQDGYAVVNGILKWTSANQKWSLVGGVQNIFEEDYIETSIFNANLQIYPVIPNRGREWYLTVSVDVW